jgi:hypothetical protein
VKNLRIKIQTYQIEILVGVMLYLGFDLLIPYTSSYALMMTTACWVFIPVAIALRSSLGTSYQYFALILLLELVIIWTASRVTRAGSTSGDASEAVSYGTFIGIGPSSASEYFYLIVFGSLLFSALIFFFLNKFTGARKMYSTEANLVDVSGKTRSKPLEIVSLFFLVLLTCPYFEGILPNLKLFTTSPDFDSQQIHAWFDYASRGFVPMKDFWFPYNGMIHIQDGLIGYLSIWLILIVVGLILYKFVLLNSNRFTSSLLLLLTMILASNYPVITARYFFPFASLLLACYGLSQKKFSYIHYAPLSASLWMSPEVAIVVYFLFIVSVGVHLIISKGTLIPLNHIFKACAAVTISLLIEIFMLASNKSLFNLVTFLSKPSETIQYGFSPIQGIRFNLSRDLNQNFRMMIFLLVIMVFVISTANMIRLLINRIPITNEIYLFMVGIFSMTLLQKEIVRGGPTLWITALLVLSTVGILARDIPSTFSDLEDKSFKDIITRTKIYSVVGISLLMFATPVLAGTFTQVARSPQQVKYLAKEFTSGALSDIYSHSDWRTANANLKNGLYSVLGVDTANLIEDNFFILGDRPDMYRALSSKPYWLISQYNMSPIREQNKVIDEIVKRKPRYLVVDKRPEALSFDGVASSIRLYKIYQFLIPRYELYKSYATFDLMVAKEGSSNSFEYWNVLLGNSLDLGSIPAAATEPEVCDSNTLKCGTFIKLSQPNTQLQNLTVTCRKTDYVVNFNPITRGREGWISLDRLWFWGDNCSVDLALNPNKFRGQLGSYLY